MSSVPVPAIPWAWVGTEGPQGFMPLRRCPTCGNPIVWFDVQKANGFDVLRLVVWGEENEVRCADHLTARENRIWRG